MPTFEELYRRLLLASIGDKTREELASLAASLYDHSQLDCLLNPRHHPVIWRFGDCDCCTPEEQRACAAACPFGAASSDGKKVVIDWGDCTGCGACIENCKGGRLVASRDAIAVLETLHAKKSLTYALVAPAFPGQFGGNVTPGQLRSALKRMGFDGMVEVAAFADILTLKEALEFDRNIVGESDYQLTSCCCPMWIAMIRKVYAQLMPHIPPAVSPMIACGRTVKKLHPDAVTVFVGPCVAKKAEAREPDIAGAVDYVLTFQETREIFDAMRIEPAKLEENEKEFSSRAGRIYARVGGVSEAVKSTLERLHPNRELAIAIRHADGVPACRVMLDDLVAGKADANFFEGMGCTGGCVGGPKVVLDKGEASERVNRYGDAAAYPTPIDNPYVVDLLRRLGIDSPEKLLEQSDIFTRKFA